MFIYWLEIKDIHHQSNLLHNNVNGKFSKYTSTMYIYEISDHSTCNKIANICNKSGIKYKSCLSYYCQFPINNFILIYTKPNNNKSITHKHNNLQSLSFSLAIYRPMHVWLLDLSKIAVCAIQCHQIFFHYLMQEDIWI